MAKQSKTFIASGFTCTEKSNLKVKKMKTNVDFPDNLFEKAAGTGFELHGAKSDGKVRVGTVKTNVSVRDTDGKPTEQVVGDGIFTNDWIPLKSASELSPYELEGKCYVLIVCNIFKGRGKLFRTGAEDDIEAMEELFESLNCEVLIEKNVYEDDLDRILKRFKSKLVKGGYSSSIVIIMSHGGRSTNSILMDDMKEKNLYRNFVYQFSHNKFPEFQGKPKIFLVQACQDYGDDELRDVSYDNDAEGQLETDSTLSANLEKVTIQDVLVSFATTPYQKALRTNRGSFYIQAIKEVFDRQAKKGRSLRAMLYEVHKNVTDKCKEYNEEQSVTSYESAFKNYVFKIK